jgi:predicted house-cleaning NTP pyrophosphatase (Maf/HAM1 superfamily)
MVDSSYYRRQAATCRDLARKSPRREYYLLDLAMHFERQASALEAPFAGNKPRAPAERLATRAKAKAKVD